MKLIKFASETAKTFLIILIFFGIGGLIAVGFFSLLTIIDATSLQEVSVLLSLVLVVSILSTVFGRKS